MIKKRLFKIWAYTVSHSVLFLRSEMQYPDVEYKYLYKPNCTIDLEFTGVEFMNIRSDFILESINVISFNEKIGIDKKDIKGLSIFEIQHNKGSSFVVAHSCFIGKSNWINEHRITNPNFDYPELLNHYIVDSCHRCP